MDGNGRWAQSHGARIFGHRAGAKVVRGNTTHASKQGIRYLTLYAFSHWKRPQDEVEGLMKLLWEYLKSKKRPYLKTALNCV